MLPDRSCRILHVIKSRVEVLRKRTFFTEARTRLGVRFGDGGLVVKRTARYVFIRNRCLGQRRWLCLSVALALLCGATCGEVVSQDNSQTSQAEQPASDDQNPAPADKPSGSADGEPDQRDQTSSPAASGDSASGDSASGDSDETDGDQPPPNDLTLPAVEKEWDSIDSSSSIEDAVKEALRPIYRQTIETLRQAEAHKNLEADYRKAVDTAPQETEELKRQLSELPTLEEAADVDMQLDVQELQKTVAQRQDKLVVLRNELSSASSDWTRILARRDEITVRVAKLKTELSQVRAKLASPELAKDVSSQRRVAERWLIKAQQAAMVAEDQMLAMELKSQDEREQLASAKQELLKRQEENSAARVAKLQTGGP